MRFLATAWIFPGLFVAAMLAFPGCGDDSGFRPSSEAGVTVAPVTAAVGPGEEVDFEAEVTDLEDQSVSWAVNGDPGGSAGYGTIDSDGLYTAPDAAPDSGAIIVSATSVADTSLHGSAGVTVISVSLSPGMPTVTAGRQVQLEATVSGLEDPDLSWSVNGEPGGNAECGTVDVQGLYTAPLLIPGQTTVTVRCTCTDHPTAYAETSIAVARALLVTPPTAALGPTEHLDFEAEVAGAEDQSVTWYVNGEPGGSTEHGTIDAAGLYTAPEVAPAGRTATISATSVTDPSLHGDAEITVIVVSITPEATTIGAGQHVSLEAEVTGLDGAQIVWLVDGTEGGNGTVGTIDSQGSYSAPNVVFDETAVTVTAACADHPTAYAEAIVTVIKPIKTELEDYTSFVDLGATGIHKQSCGAASGGWAVEGFELVGEALFYQVSFDHEGSYAGVLTAAAIKDYRSQITVTIQSAGPGGEDQVAVFEVIGMGIT